jgi:hypothetical protein
MIASLTVEWSRTMSRLRAMNVPRAVVPPPPMSIDTPLLEAVEMGYNCLEPERPNQMAIELELFQPHRELCIGA